MCFEQINEAAARACRERDELRKKTAEQEKEIFSLKEELRQARSILTEKYEEALKLLEAAKNAQGLLQIHLVKVQEERDALFEEVRGLCHTCKKRNTDFDCEKKCYGHQRGSAWEWKGAAADRG